MEENNIIEGPKVEPILGETSLGELTLLLLNTHGENILQIDAEADEQLPASLIINRSVCLAKWLQSLGFGHGDYVSINSENRLEFCTVPIATFLIGATFAPLNPEYTPGELKHVLNLTKPKIIFCSEKTIDKMISILPDHPYIQHLVLFGNKKAKLKKVTMFNNLMAGVSAKPSENIDFEPPSVDPEETVATILCSSGTTGLPKGVMCTQANMIAYLEIGRYILSSYLEEGYDTDIAIGLAPFFHSMGFMIMYLSLLRGRRMIVFPRFAPIYFLNALQKYKVSRIEVPPTVAVFLAKHPMVEKYDLSNLKEVLCGAAPMSKDLEQSLLKKFGSIRKVNQAYGMTETTLSVLISPADKVKSGSPGIIVPNMKCKVINEKGEALGAYQEGELCFKGPLIMKGYIGDKKATEETIDKDGWLHTGDVGYYDSDGYFYVVDRIKELIKYKAYQVAPAELEALLLQHPAVADVAVVGLPDEVAGEIPLAYVVKKPDTKVSEKELEKYIEERVSSQKRIRGGVHFIDAIPRNTSGKILRRVLREQAKKSKL